MWLFLHKRCNSFAHVRETLWFHPLQCKVCDVYCGIYHIKMTINLHVILNFIFIFSKILVLVLIFKDIIIHVWVSKV
jgi:hypothetical protein